MIKRVFVCLFCLGLFFVAACIPHRREDDLKMLSSGILELTQSEEIAKVAYVSMQDADNRMPGLREQIENCLLSRGFATTNNPSEAGYIIQLALLATGSTSLESVAAVVANGYAGEVRLDGEGGTALVADALVAQRRVPQSGKKKLKTISNRMVVTDDQMRLAIFSPRKFDLKSEFPEYVIKKAAEEICRGIDVTVPVSR
jgi:hypothetical protein